jgi:hypothetical protein
MPLKDDDLFEGRFSGFLAACSGPGDETYSPAGQPARGLQQCPVGRQ